ncbi:MAG: OPT/YSL family transporter [Candidatus Babeliales bacterium]|nr:OPT/YSL family transporter [Candidatus Babeliales bacterium]
MLIIAIFFSILFSVFSTVVMSYISMATPIGPWIAPTIAMLAMLILKLFTHRGSAVERVGLITTAGSIGGILATGMGFSFPTLYFVDPVLFNQWLATPVYFVGMLAALSITAGGFGLWLANILEHRFIIQQDLAFPVGQLVYKMIAVEEQIKKTWDLVIGFVGTLLFCLVQDGLFAFKGFIPKALTLVPAFNLGVVTIPTIRFDLFPMLWAIGFVTGHVIAIPLIVGALTKIFLIDPLNHLYFPTLSGIEFVLAFCSGMVLSGTLMSFIGAPKLLYKSIKKIINNGTSNFNVVNASTGLSKLYVIEGVILLVALISFLSYLGLSFFAQLYVLIFTAMCTYEIIDQAGKIGLAALGRFATFVMVPGMLLFNLTLVQIVFIAAFVEICGGVAVDVLFGRKLARCADISRSKMERFQWLGLFISALTVGAVFLVLINQFGLGSSELFALKAQNRQLLINAHSFNLYVLLFGFIFGFILKEIKINPSLVLGGILMPINMSLGLIVGGLCALFTTDRERWYPFWSGVFASNSIWMLIRAIL